jgi:hypothetical protein
LRAQQAEKLTRVARSPCVVSFGGEAYGTAFIVPICLGGPILCFQRIESPSFVTVISGMVATSKFA